MIARIAFLGDTLLGGDGQDVLDELGYDYALAGIRPLLSSADIVVANHEGPLTNLTAPEHKLHTDRRRYWYRGAPESVGALVRAGVGVVSLANNHVCDFGHGGLLDTLTHLDAAGIAHCGAGRDSNEAHRPAIIDVNGNSIGFLSVMQRYDLYVDEHLYASPNQPGPCRLRIGRVQREIRELKEIVDVVVVLVHWGRNYRVVAPRQQRLAKVLQEAGADLIIGHHPHIPQRVELLDATPVVYSLGNGALGTRGRFHSGRPPYGLITTVEIEAGRVPAMEFRIIEVDNNRIRFQPRPAPASTEEAILGELLDPSIHDIRRRRTP